MKQVIINQLDGGFVVQTVENGQPQNSVVRTTFAKAVKEARKIFDLVKEVQPEPAKVGTVARKRLGISPNAQG